LAARPRPERFANPFFQSTGEAPVFVANDPDNAPIGEDPQLDALEERIEKARKAEAERLSREHAPLREGQGIGFQVISTMVGYPLGGILIGLLLDNVFGTLPWITIGLMFTAFAGACLHVFRMINNRSA